ncbi:MAG TPA: exopolysaccharide biosynthesis protein [Alphaproteobacteria bacterium]|nr:exopolysaccharide biosynthesis protein [Alphaproteobacteria bacterium]
MSKPELIPVPLPKGEHAPEDSIADVLRRIGAHSEDERVTLGEILASLDHRAYGFVLLLLAAANFTPGPSMPGFSTLFGLPAMAMAVQMMLGWSQPWLPPRLARIGMKRARFTATVAKALPVIARLDRVLRPRLTWLVNLTGHRWTGAAVLVQAMLLCLPLPLYPMAPAASLVLMSLGMIARDGLMLALGHVAGVLALGLAVALVFVAKELLAFL